jgi:membrane protein DedA with SNARE-associated domain
MDLLSVVAHHGYAVVAGALLLASCGLPLPLSVVLLTAGAAAHHGALNVWLVMLYAFGAGLLGDTLMYFGGRTTGWWLLAGLCRVSMNPDTCIWRRWRLRWQAA